jgi:hypothetical protein
MIRSLTIASLFAFSLLATPTQPVASQVGAQSSALKAWPIPTCAPCTFPTGN